MSTVLGARAVLAMLAGTMIPEAFERTRTHTYTGLVATVGLALSFGPEPIG